eukprot:TRINITY_DN8079_c3_g1_i5.p3 TRINITY_DN8079_c3_g1~~TRINITY_DN8079_c3_g1_i5.p3  ORF type:complete len:122 (-),score=24.85 TRINITY_DN8079_c3_g1_i5:105-470(-)
MHGEPTMTSAWTSQRGSTYDAADVKKFTKRISTYAKTKQVNKAFEVFEEMQQRGVQPNAITFNALINACGKGSQAEKAVEVFEEMQQRGLTPDVITYSALISACAKGSQAEKAVEVFEEDS